MKYIETLREGERIGEVYLCKQKVNALTKNGKAYESLTLQDKTGTLDAKIWDPNSQGIDDFDAMDYIDVMGDITSFQGSLQLNVKRVRKASEGEYEPNDYLPMSEYNIEEMYQKIMNLIDSIQNPFLKQLLTSFYGDQKLAKELKFHSAAKSVHHGFVGGLVEHTLSVTEICDFFAGHYTLLNRDMLISASLLHDIGKLTEISSFPTNDYTDEGNLLGHIIIGTEMVTAHAAEIPNFPQTMLNQLKHCILAHHGELEYGSPKKPAMVEAVALSFADNIDAKMETLKEIFNGTVDPQADWVGYQRLFESNIRKTIL